MSLNTPAALAFSELIGYWMGFVIFVLALWGLSKILKFKKQDFGTSATVVLIPFAVKTLFRFVTGDYNPAWLMVLAVADLFFIYLIKTVYNETWGKAITAYLLIQLASVLIFYSPIIGLFSDYLVEPAWNLFDTAPPQIMSYSCDSYSINYLSDWGVEEESGGGLIDSVIFTSPSQKDVLDTSAIFTVNAKQFSSTESYDEETVEKYLSNSFSDSPGFNLRENVCAKTQDAMECNYTFTSTYNNIQVVQKHTFIIRGSRLYDLMYAGEERCFDRFMNVSEMMRNSFNVK